MQIAVDNPYDPLKAADLPPTAGMELDHRTRLLTDGEVQHLTFRLLILMSAIGAVLAFGLTIMAQFAATWLFLTIAVFVCSVIALLLYIYKYPPYEILAWCICAPLIWLLSQATANGLHVLLWLVAVACAMHFAHAVLTHRGYWMNAHPQLDRSTRCVWRSVWTVAPFWHAFGKLIRSRKDASVTPTSRAGLEEREEGQYCLGFALVLIASLAGALALLLLPGPFLGGFVAISVYLLAMTMLGSYRALQYRSDIGWPSLIRSIFDACVSWLTYNKHGTLAPGVFQSPAGHYERRVALTALVLGVSALAIVPVSAYFPLAALIYGPGPWQEAARKSWALSELFSESPTVSDHLLQQIPRAQRDRFQAALAATAPRELIPTSAVRLDEHDSYLFATLQGITRGEPFFIASLTVSVLACVAVTPLFLFATVFGLGARRLLHHETTLVGNEEHAGKYHRPEPLTAWEAYVDRLQSSEFKTSDHAKHSVRENEQLFLGFNPSADYPILLDPAILAEHAHITGDSGSGKSTLGIAPLVTQLIGRPDTSIVILDLKGDPALFEGARLSVEAANRRHPWKKHRLPFRWFTNMTGRSTYAFNPFLQAHVADLTIQQRASIILQSLGLDYGEGYGTAYFSSIHRDILTKVLRDEPGINSFRKLRKYLVDDLPTRRRELKIEKRQYEEASHLYTVVDSLAGFDAINVTPDKSPDDHVLRLQIDMGAVVRHPQVIYFYLPSALEESSVREIAKLAMHSLLTAAVHRGQSKHRVYVFVDEFQQVVSQNLEIVLRQARSHGMSAILANQTISDLKLSQNVNLIPTVQGNTRFRQVFSASDLEAQDFLSRGSGESIYYLGSWSATDPPEVGGFSEQIGPRLRPDDIMEFSDRERHSLVQVTRSRGFTQFGGRTFPMVSDFHIEADEYKRRSEAPWPTPREGTLQPVPEKVAPRQPSTVPPSRSAPAAPKTLPQPVDEIEARLEKLFDEQEQKT